MKRTLAILLPVLALVIAVPVYAGGEKCTAGTQECLDMMVESYANRGWIGLEFDYGADHAMAVSKIVEDSPAEKAGFKAGDVMIAVNGVAYADGNEEAMMAIHKQMLPGAEMTFTVQRDGKNTDLATTLAAMPERVLMTIVGSHMVDHAKTDLAEKN